MLAHPSPVQPVGSHHDSDVLCFSVKEGYKVRLDLNITLEFRTSSKNGVLLGISSAKVDAIGLEIVDGKVGGLSASPAYPTIGLEIVDGKVGGPPASPAYPTRSRAGKKCRNCLDSSFLLSTSLMETKEISITILKSDSPKKLCSEKLLFIYLN